MLKIVTLFLDLIFPPRQTELLVRNTGPETKKHLFQPGIYQSVYYLSSYRNPHMEALIKENKYHCNQHAASILGELLVRWLETMHDQPMVLIPIPQSAERKREREYNQIESILEQVKVLPFVTVNTNLIVKTRHTPTQTSLNRDARLENVAGSFSLSPQANMAALQGTTVVIVDDVVTTGATMKAAAAALPPETSVVLLALAH